MNFLTIFLTLPDPPGNHSLTVWVNGGEQEPLGAQYGWAEQDMDLYQYVFETFYGNNSMTIDFDVPFINGCTDPWAGNFDPSANTDDGSCDYSSVMNLTNQVQ